MTELATITVYEIKIQERLKEKWADWFSGMLVRIPPGDGGSDGTELIVSVPDQAALRGVLNRLWDLNLTLVSVNLQVEERNSQ